jgi:hypothetical protein
MAEDQKARIDKESVGFFESLEDEEEPRHSGALYRKELEDDMVEVETFNCLNLNFLRRSRLDGEDILLLI